MKPVKTLLSCAVLAATIAACTQPLTDPATEIQTHDETRAERVSVSDGLSGSAPPLAVETVSAQMPQGAAMKRMAVHEGFPRMPSRPAIDRENYLPIEQNDIRQVSAEPVSTFSIDVDTASYANVRRMLANEGRLPPHDAVRIEEMINYFSYGYDVPNNTDRPFSVSTELAPSPWNAERKLLQIGLKGYEPDITERKAANLVFLIDVSGSMRGANKLPLVKKSLRLLVNNLEDTDRIALVVYAGAAGVVLESTPVREKNKIMAAIDQLEAGGSTHGSAGIELAYQVAEQNLVKDGINRVLIASDGDMNVGTVSIDALKELIEEKRKSGVALTTLGFGTGNYNYSLMEQLADVGNGNASYIDTLKEAHKVLVKESRSTLLTIASDVKIQVEFNPAVVAEYRLIGYENRMLKREDFTNDKVDAGEIGAGHTVTALYELTLTNSDSKRLEPLRYENNSSRESTDPVNTEELAFVKLRYKLPGETTSTEMTEPVLTEALKNTYQAASTDFRFASAVAAFGQLLSGAKYTEGFGFTDARDAMRDARGDDPDGYRSELLSLVELAAGLSVAGG